MFEDIGRKLKNLAEVASILGIIGSLITGLSLIADNVLTGLLAMVLGAVFSWVGGSTVYGLGQLIENTDELVKQGREKPGTDGTVHASVAIKIPDTASAVQDPPKAPPCRPIVSDTTIDLGNGIVRCPHCKTIQNKRDVCRYCHKPLDPTQ